MFVIMEKRSEKFLAVQGDETWTQDDVTGWVLTFDDDTPVGQIWQYQNEQTFPENFQIMKLEDWQVRQFFSGKAV
jgi:hypothetical protein